LVDRPAILDLFVGCGAIAAGRLAVVCIDGRPSSIVAALRRRFREGCIAPVVYIHDSATVVYPFTLEPLASLLRAQEGGRVLYADLGLPPLGASARRFGDRTPGSNELVFELEAIPPETLVKYVTEAASRLARESAEVTHPSVRRTTP
jgi:hypothetical protein